MYQLSDSQSEIDHSFTVKLLCLECDNDECPLCGLLTWVNDENQKGCTRRVDEETYVNYYNLLFESWPVSLQHGSEKQVYQDYSKIQRTLQKIYKSDLLNTRKSSQLHIYLI